MARRIVGEKATIFALEIIELYKQLLDHREYVISKQLLRSAKLRMGVFNDHGRRNEPEYNGENKWTVG